RAPPTRAPSPPVGSPARRPSRARAARSGRAAWAPLLRCPCSGSRLYEHNARGPGFLPCRTVLRRALVDPLDRAEHRLGLPREGEEALLMDRRVRPRVAPLPIRPYAELAHGPPDRARKPRLRPEHAEVERRG